MKKLILLLLISSGLSAQVVVPKSTTTFSNIVATGSETVTGNLKVVGSGTFTGSVTSGIHNVNNTGLDSCALGSELLTNNSFSANLNSWTNGGSWSWSAGKAVHTSTSATTLSQSVTVVSGSTYYVYVTTSGRTAGDLAFQLGTSNYSYSLSISGLYNSTDQKTFVANTTGTVNFVLTPSSDFDGSVDECSIKLATLNGVTSNINLYNKQSVLSNEVRASSGNNSVYFGLNSGRTNVSGSSNSVFGNSSLYSNTTGYQNTVFGYKSMYSNTTGYSNDAHGIQALYYNISGSRNSAFGIYSLLNNTTGRFNIAYGAHSLSNNTTGSFNVAIGGSTMMNGTNTGDFNTAVGSSAMNSAGGYYNTAIGASAIATNTAGGYNTAIGGLALTVNTGGSNNSALGLAALQNATGSSNIGIGYAAGAFYTSGNNRLFINNVSRTNIAGDTTKSIIYGVMAANVNNQILKLFAHTSVLHLMGNSSAPTCTLSTGAGAGATYTLTSNSTDMAGQIAITAAGTPASNATIATLTFNTAYSVAPIVILTPGNGNAASLGTTTQVYATSTTTTFLIKSNPTSGLSTGDYIWNWHIIQ